MTRPGPSFRRGNIALWVLALHLAACQQPAGSDAVEAGPEAAADSGQRAAAAPTNAATPGPTLPPAALTAWEQYAKSECREMGAAYKPVRFVSGQPTSLERSAGANEGTYVIGDFNGDEIPDFLVTTDNWGCSGPTDNGQMGPPNDAIISKSGGYRADYAFNGWIDQKNVKRRGQRDVIEYSKGWSGSCGPIATVVWGWTGAAMEPIERRDDKGRKVDSEGCAATGQGGLPVKTGLWADERAGGCGAMAANDPAFILTRDRMLFPQDYKELKPVKALGGGRYQTGSERNFDQQIMLIQSPTKMRIEGEFGGSYAWCSASTRWQPWEGEF